MAPKLSICVPSRNRQQYFQQTILALIENPRREVEFVFADNSDDPSIMTRFMAELPADPRIKFLPPEKSVLSMVDNWERTVEATTGDWVTVIGDDDYVDPDVAALLARLEATPGGCDALNWRNVGYYWPGPQVKRANISISLNSDIVRIPRARLIRRLFLWEQSTCAPSVGYSIYHSAISRSLLEKIRARFGGRYFEHPTVDYDSAFKVVLLGERFVYTSRPFSIHGRCPVSSSGSMQDLDAVEKKSAEFMSELGRDLQHETDPDVPLPYFLGMTASILQTMLWISRKYGLNFDGWQENFAKACGENCYLYSDQVQFDRMANSYRAALSKWADGRYLKFFNPIFVPGREGAAFSGLLEDIVYFLDDERYFATPDQLYTIMSALFEAADTMPIDGLLRDASGELPLTSLFNVSPEPLKESDAPRARRLG
jgi:glycosyltransferase involved in cell wall biosynthesis